MASNVPEELMDDPSRKFFIPLENNPTTMTNLARSLGISPTHHFTDIYSFDPTALTHLPRPAVALLAIIPMTPSWSRLRAVENAKMPYPYPLSGADEPVLWIKQTIGHACGLIGLLHILLNPPASSLIIPGTLLAELREKLPELGMEERSQYLYDSKELEEKHAVAAQTGDTRAPSLEEGEPYGFHFVAFVKGEDGVLWELEGSRRGALNRGQLDENEDVLSERGVAMGMGRYLKMAEETGERLMGFSCIALVEGEGED